MTDPIIIGTRGSTLALVQAGLVRSALEAAGHSAQLTIIETEGDRRAPDTAWGEGAFVAAIEQALLDGRADVAVHSAKDVPIERDARLSIAAYLPRADPRDALVVRSDAAARCLADLPAGSRVGTDSPRRTGFIRARRPDLDVHPLHGNVDTRLRRLDEGGTDALVLACAGLDRLGLGHRIVERFELTVVPPAPGQGAIAVEVRRDDSRLVEAAAAIDDRVTRLAVETERAFLEASGGGCRAPVGALATIDGDQIRLRAGRASPSGSGTIFGERRGHSAMGPAIARELVAELSRPAPPTSHAHRSLPRVIVTRAADRSAGLARALRDAGIDPLVIPTITVARTRAEELRRFAEDLGRYRWVAVTSANGARAVLDAAAATATDPGEAAWAVVGDATAEALRRAGIEPSFRPTRSTAEQLATELPVAAGERVLVVRGDIAGDRVAERLRARGAAVDDVVAYRTIEGPQGSVERLRRAMGGVTGPDAVLFTSGSTVRGLLAIGRAAGCDVGAIPAICLGPETAREARALGFRVVAVAPVPDVASLALTTATALVAELQETS